MLVESIDVQFGSTNGARAQVKPHWMNILGTLKSIVEIAQAATEMNSRSKRRRWEVIHEPLFNRMIAIHHDYTKRLCEFSLKMYKDSPRDALYQDLALVRKALLAERIEVDAYLHRIRSDRIHRNMMLPECAFLQKIDLYLHSYFTGRSAFTGLMYMFDPNCERYRARLVAFQIGNAAVDPKQQEARLIAEQLNNAIEWLAVTFSEITFHYHEIRLAFIDK
jgi:hypothetical protein